MTARTAEEALFAQVDRLEREAEQLAGEWPECDCGRYVESASGEYCSDCLDAQEEDAREDRR